jgi:hypothetical protein
VIKIAEHDHAWIMALYEQWPHPRQVKPLFVHHAPRRYMGKGRFWYLGGVIFQIVSGICQMVHCRVMKLLEARNRGRFAPHLERRIGYEVA